MPREVCGRSKDKHNPGVCNTSEIAKTKKKKKPFGINASKMIEQERKHERSLNTTRSKGQRARPTR
jgi:hypothetical protein